MVAFDPVIPADSSRACSAFPPTALVASLMLGMGLTLQ
jgi:hypothetical protein